MISMYILAASQIQPMATEILTNIRYLYLSIINIHNIDVSDSKRGIHLSTRIWNESKLRT